MTAVEYHVTIKDMPSSLRPRERLLANGAGALSDTELVAIILRSGTAETSALNLAALLLTRFGGLRGLLEAATEELISVPGMGPAKAVQVKAALEIGRRVATSAPESRPVVRTPDDVAKLVMETMRHLDREHFRALLLNTKNQVLSIETISVGTLDSSTVHPRELFKSAVKKSAAAVILVHNHPSGDPTPSQADIDLTGRLVQAGSILGIGVLDHIVIGDNRYTSFKACGLL
ncbi:MAG: DNA repair protein RadC [Clostridia bacterium 62_21]|nr:MAG: DNA repair protein RadC [Clostridia bacterium 62_21]